MRGTRQGEASDRHPRAKWIICGNPDRILDGHDRVRRSSQTLCHAQPGALAEQALLRDESGVRLQPLERPYSLQAQLKMPSDLSTITRAGTATEVDPSHNSFQALLRMARAELCRI